MKVLLNCRVPFSLTHGGAQIQIEQTKAALENVGGVEVEWLRWWDEHQRGDLIHFFGTPTTGDLDVAWAANIPFISTTLFTETCNRSDARLRLQGWFIKSCLAFPFGNGVKRQLSWQAFRKCACNVVGLNAERKVLECVYGVEPSRIAVVPLGLSEMFLRAGTGKREHDHLICTGTITERKNCVELAEMARATHTPILFVGKPYLATDPYWSRFKALIDNQFVKHHPHVTTQTEMVRLLKAAKGFVLMSNFENWCLSAHEAVACGLPLLVPDQKWSRERFGNQAHYFPSVGRGRANTEILRHFFAEAPRLAPPRITLPGWKEVAAQLRQVYERVLSTSR